MADHSTNAAAPPAAGGARRAVSVISLISWLPRLRCGLDGEGRVQGQARTTVPDMRGDPARYAKRRPGQVCCGPGATGPAWQHARVRASDQGLAGALFTTSQQTGAAVGLAILATAAAAATDGHGGSLVDGYRLSFLIATGLAVLAAIIVALQLSAKSQRAEPRRQQAGPGGPPPAPPAPAKLGKS